MPWANKHRNETAACAGNYLVSLGGSTRLIDTNSTVAVVNSRVQSNSVFNVTTPLLRTSGPAANSTTADNSTAVDGGAMWLRGSLLSGNEAVLPLVASNMSRGFYSDAPREYYSAGEDALVATTEPPKAEEGAFLSREHPWFKEISEVRAPLEH